MLRRLLLLLLFGMTIRLNVLAQSDPPKREFRGAWIATVLNLDWPATPGLNSTRQREEFIQLLDGLQNIGINAVIFQIRTECDALYASPFEPWSYYLSGQQGRAPSPYYDPLEFAVAEAHRRGMEIHAWFNPYRAVKTVGSYPQDATHVTRQHPDWVIQIGSFKFLNPGLPQVRDYVTQVVLDVVQRYDIDGVHFDDYFYPYPPDQITNQDDSTFLKYNRGFTNRGDWRRDNVNLLIQMIHTGIQALKPYVKFGMSPFGIWKNGVPTGITGLDAYSSIYCDAPTWLKQQTIDYLTPQLYWPFGGGQDYGKLLPWWASQMNGRHLYPGQAAYRITGWTATEMPRQIRLNRKTPLTLGSIFFRARSLLDNPKGFADSLQANYYRYLSLMPIMTWKDSVPPESPQTVRYARIPGTGTAGLQWDLPVQATDGDTATRYVIYRFNHAQPTLADLENPAYILAISGRRRHQPLTPANLNTPYYFQITALDRGANESTPGPLVAVTPPERPVLAQPADDARDLPPLIALSWYYPQVAASYQLQVAPDSSFAAPASILQWELTDTVGLVSELPGQTRYYWRVCGRNAGGTGPFSTVHSFVTGAPATPELVSPANNTGNIPLLTNFIWRTTLAANSYRIQVARSQTFDTTALVLDVAPLTDTTCSGPDLQTNKFYFWRVQAANPIGNSRWSSVFKFKTTPVAEIIAVESEFPTAFRLYPNFPNPFNSQTTIRFDLPVTGHVVLQIYDAIGREVALLLDQPLTPGQHRVQFESGALPSGIYFIRISMNGQPITRKMVLLK